MTRSALAAWTGQTKPADPRDARLLRFYGNRRGEERKGEGEGNRCPSANHLVTVPPTVVAKPNAALSGRKASNARPPVAAEAHSSAPG